MEIKMYAEVLLFNVERNLFAVCYSILYLLYECGLTLGYIVAVFLGDILGVRKKVVKLNGVVLAVDRCRDRIEFL